MCQAQSQEVIAGVCGQLAFRQVVHRLQREIFGLLAVRTYQLRGFEGLLEVRFGALCISEPLHDFTRLPQHKHQLNFI
jgi:hypothetical protein